MNNILLAVIVLVLAIGGYFVYKVNYKDIDAEVNDIRTEAEVSDASQPGELTARSLEDGPSVMPISHATMVLTWGNETVYVDPVGGADSFEDLMAPTLVLVTDVHGDHLSTSTLENIIAADTLLVAPQAVYDRMTDTLKAQTQILANGETVEVKGFSLTGVPMYNVPESADAYHVKGRGNGYVLERNNTRVYIAGDTGATDEMRSLRDIDMAFVPMNLPYTMTVEAAAEVVLTFAPQTVIPYHYRGPDGLSDVELFKQLVETKNSNIEVLLLNWYPEVAEVEE